MEWFRKHPWHGSINEEHLHCVDINKPVIQAEFNPGFYKIIDGNHRMEFAYRNGIAKVEFYQLNVKQLIAYFADIRGYRAFVDYWNSKLE